MVPFHQRQGHPTTRRHRGPAPPLLRPVDHVVVQQRRLVRQLHRRHRSPEARARVPLRRRGQAHERPDQLATPLRRRHSRRLQLQRHCRERPSYPLPRSVQDSEPAAHSVISRATRGPPGHRLETRPQRGHHHHTTQHKRHRHGRAPETGGHGHPQRQDHVRAVKGRLPSRRYLSQPLPRPELLQRHHQRQAGHVPPHQVHERHSVIGPRLTPHPVPGHFAHRRVQRQVPREQQQRSNEDPRSRPARRRPPACGTTAGAPAALPQPHRQTVRRHRHEEPAQRDQQRHEPQPLHTQQRRVRVRPEWNPERRSHQLAPQADGIYRHECRQPAPPRPPPQVQRQNQPRQENLRLRKEPERHRVEPRRTRRQPHHPRRVPPEHRVPRHRHHAEQHQYQQRRPVQPFARRRLLAFSLDPHESSVVMVRRCPSPIPACLSHV